MSIKYMCMNIHKIDVCCMYNNHLSLSRLKTVYFSAWNLNQASGFHYEDFMWLVRHKHQGSW